MPDTALFAPSAALLRLIARAEAAPGSDEAYFLSQLRAAIAGMEGHPTPFRTRPRSPRPAPAPASAG